MVPKQQHISLEQALLSPNGEYLVARPPYGTQEQLNIVRSRDFAVLTSFQCKGPCVSFAWLRDADTVVAYCLGSSHGDPSYLKIFTIHSQQPTKTFELQQLKNSETGCPGEFSFAASWSADGSLLRVAVDDRSTIFRSETGQVWMPEQRIRDYLMTFPEKRRQPPRYNALAWRKDFSMAAVAEPSLQEPDQWMPALARERHFQFMSLPSTEAALHVATPVDKSIACNHVFSPCGTMLAMNGTRPLAITIIEVATGQTKWQTALAENAFEPAVPLELPGFVGDTKPAIKITLPSLLSWSADSRYLAFPKDPTTIAVLDVEAGKTCLTYLFSTLHPLLEQYEGRRESKGLAAGLCAAVSPDGQLLFACMGFATTEGYIIRLPNDISSGFCTGQLVGTLKFDQPLKGVTAAWYPKGSRLLVQGEPPHHIHGGVKGLKPNVAMDVELHSLL